MTIGHNSGVRGTFADFKTVKTRGVCQLIIEVPIEAADHALTVLGGVPQAKAEQWVGIAPIVAPGATTQPPAEQTTVEAKLKGGPLSQRAGMNIRNTIMQSFLANLNTGGHWETDPPSAKLSEAEANARYKICAWCMTSNLREIDHSEDARERFKHLTMLFTDSQRGWTP